MASAAVVWGSVGSYCLCDVWNDDVVEGEENESWEVVRCLARPGEPLSLPVK
jgi:hypothetical protein